MYCIKCGAELADGETSCPLCRTRVYHPDFNVPAGEEFYPKKKYPDARRKSFFPQIVLTFAFILPMIIVLLCDLQFSVGITWSGYVIGALVIGYVALILPLWFKKPNPVIFVPCSFAAVVVYLLYINFTVNGNWFLSFAFPIAGGIGVIVTAVVTLMRYLRRGRLYIIGGAFAAFGAFILLMEFMLTVTFDGIEFVGWSLYPLTVFILFGGMLIFLGISRTAREAMERKFFI